jgi:hypothetical protein
VHTRRARWLLAVSEARAVGERATMSQRSLKAVLPPPDHEPSWRRLQNLVYLAGEDALFEWLRGVRAYVERAERDKRRAA